MDADRVHVDSREAYDWSEYEAYLDSMEQLQQPQFDDAVQIAIDS